MLVIEVYSGLICENYGKIERSFMTRLGLENHGDSE